MANGVDVLNGIDPTIAGAVDPSALAGGAAGGALAGGLIAFIMAWIVVSIIVLVIVYIYLSYVYMRIAQKAKYKTPGLAWIPLVGPALISADIAKMDWWPLLLGVAGMIFWWIPVIGPLLSLAFLVFLIIWTWKVFERFGRPGWWSIFWIIWPVELVFLGIVAWSDNRFK